VIVVGLHLGHLVGLGWGFAFAEAIVACRQQALVLGLACLGRVPCRELVLRR
jgi:hypothetical protein